MWWDRAQQHLGKASVLGPSRLRRTFRAELGFVLPWIKPSLLDSKLGVSAFSPGVRMPPSPPQAHRSPAYLLSSPSISFLYVRISTSSASLMFISS